MSKLIVLSEEKMREAICVAIVDASASNLPSVRADIFMDMIRYQAMKYGHVVDEDSMEGLQVRAVLVGV